MTRRGNHVKPAPVEELSFDDKPARTRTTITPLVATVILLKKLELEALERGERTNYSKLIDEAVSDLARKRGIDAHEHTSTRT